MTKFEKNYSLVTELVPQKIGVQDPETGDYGEHDLNRDQRQAALNRAHEIRKFEIELYWKRATYFWVLQAAVFAAISFVWKAKELELSPVIPVAFAALGLVTSVAGILSAKGSKFWQENWEHHIDMLEDEFEGRLHKTAYVGKDGLAWSVSRVNERLGFCFGAFWLVMLIATIDKANPWLKAGFAECVAWLSTPGFQTICVVGVMLIALLVLWMGRTEFKHARAVSYDTAAPTIDGFDVVEPKDLPEVAELADCGKPFLIRREPKI
ncbi:hypothetical protein [Sphingobium xenophagum]|uniref:RipA family octameric membrane protein n=1 Tax=Sphingobium xenophagum TaxID=121428 RepID=UPI00241CCF1E|nr:hypothetical protein [Sphingobium xenophagum]